MRSDNSSHSRICYDVNMELVLYILILIFGVASYMVGLRQMMTNKYSPSVFSRVVWALLAMISFAGVVAGGSGPATIALAAIFLIGNIAICVTSFWKGVRSSGRLEYACLAILAASAVVWVVFNTPIISLTISLIAHFVGAVPTYAKVWRDPKSESAGFWSLFFIASLLTVLTSWGQPIYLLIFPIYFALFDGIMTFLALRRNRSR